MSGRRFFRWQRLLGLMVLVTVGVALAAWLALRASLPPLDGTRPLAGLGAAVTVERDAHGVPTVRAASKTDAFRALGYLHAQDRFAQMDVLRRQAAGELAELFGPGALPLDREARIHRFRWRAAQTVRRLDPEQRAWLAAYTEGVNAGLAALSARPWEYFLLRARPRPWTPEDSVLVLDTMTMNLQEHDGRDERARLALREVYGDEALAFLRPLVRENTAALDGSSAPAPPIPDATRFAPRPITFAAVGRRIDRSAPDGICPQISQISADGRKEKGRGSRVHLPSVICGNLRNLRTNSGDQDASPGSNNFALAGARVAGGGALVANDMHLGLMVPNTWYRVSLALPGRTVTGVSLPGVPGIAAGSNGDVAWGLTDAYIDSSDVVIVERDPADPARYRVPDGDGWERFEKTHETIPVAGGPAVPIDIVSTRWGPLLTPRDNAGRTLALHWSADDPDALNMGLCDLMDARSVDEALAVVHRARIPAENFVVGDRAGHMAWTILGPVPRRVGFDGSMPQSWADGTRRWDGFFSPEEIPVVRDPPGGQLWTANNRVVGGDALARLGNGGYDEEARAAQIRDRLRALTGRLAVPADGLAVQLDDESRFLARWRGLLQNTLTDDAVRGKPALGDLRRLVRAWHGHAAVDEPGQWLVRDFRRIVMLAVMNPLYEPVRRREPGLAISRAQFRGVEQPLWSIVSARPAWLLPSAYPSWDALLLRATEITSRLGEREGGLALRDCVWGRRNTLEMRHPISAGLPGWIARWLDMPGEPLPGDNFMPRVQAPDFGASERMVVSPGREAEGIFHQPGGASGHPLSPFYRAGHDDWVHGRPTPFLPGATVYSLRLEP